MLPLAAPLLSNVIGSGIFKDCGAQRAAAIRPHGQVVAVGRPPVFQYGFAVGSSRKLELGETDGDVGRSHGDGAGCAGTSTGVCLRYLVRNIFSFSCIFGALMVFFSVTACLILYVDTVGFAYYRYVFVVRYSCLSKPLEKYFRSWQRRRLSYFFSSGAVWEFCVSSDRGDAGGYFLFPVWWIWTLLARDGGFLLELICFIVQLMNFEIF